MVSFQFIPLLPQVHQYDVNAILNYHKAKTRLTQNYTFKLELLLQ